MSALTDESRFGAYRIERHLARGGMAEIFLADSDLGRRVVLKTIRPRLAADATFVDMFLREAAVSMRLDHGNIAQVFDFGEVDGRYYLAMEYVDGISLAELLHEVDEQSERLPLPVAVHIVAAVARALDYAHSLVGDDGRPLEIVHRDVSPHNAMVAYSGTTKLVDFGIAKGRNLKDLTRPGVARGKYLYFSPEQVRARPLDRRSDVYACGVLLYELLVGRTPVTGELVEVLEAVVRGWYDAPRKADWTLPEPLERITLRAMALEPEARYPTCRELEADLLEWLRREAGPVSDELVGQYVRWVCAAQLAERGDSVPGVASPPAMLAPWRRSREPPPPTVAPDPDAAPAPMAASRRGVWPLLLGAAGLTALLVVGAHLYGQWIQARSGRALPAATPVPYLPPPAEPAPPAPEAAPPDDRPHAEDPALPPPVRSFPRPAADLEGDRTFALGSVARPISSLPLLRVDDLDPQRTYRMRVTRDWNCMSDTMDGKHNPEICLYRMRSVFWVAGTEPARWGILRHADTLALTGMRWLGLATTDAGPVDDNEGVIEVEIASGKRRQTVEVDVARHVISPLTVELSAGVAIDPGWYSKVKWSTDADIDGPLLGISHIRGENDLLRALAYKIKHDEHRYQETRWQYVDSTMMLVPRGVAVQTHHSIDTIRFLLPIEGEPPEGQITFTVELNERSPWEKQVPLAE